MKSYTEYARLTNRVTSQGVAYVHIDERKMQVTNGTRTRLTTFRSRCRCIVAFRAEE